jgi:hypothetical protein
MTPGCKAEGAIPLISLKRGSVNSHITSGAVEAAAGPAGASASPVSPARTATQRNLGIRLTQSLQQKHFQ